jgi:transcriptional regulator with XRE-family HTH domain
MTKKTQEDPLIAAVRKLRTTLGDTQPQFAERLGVALPTVVRYEHSRRPRGKAVVAMQEIAAAHGLDDLASQFRSALSDELGAPAGDLRGRNVHLKNEEERDLVDALLYAVRLESLNEQNAKAAKTIRRALKPIVDQQRRNRETSEALDAQRKAMAGLLMKGRAAEEVLKLFRTTPEALAEAFFSQGMKPSSVKTWEKKMCEVVALLLKDGWSIQRMADEFGGGSADGFLSCATELQDFAAIGQYEREQEEQDGKEH